MHTVVLRAGPLKASIEDEWPLYILLCGAWKGFLSQNPCDQFHLKKVLLFLKEIVDEQGQSIVAKYLQSEIDLLIEIVGDSHEHTQL